MNKNLTFFEALTIALFLLKGANVGIGAKISWFIVVLPLCLSGFWIVLNFFLKLMGFYDRPYKWILGVITRFSIWNKNRELSNRFKKSK